jgi:diacylglycerol kinase family enzyme
MNFKRVHVIVNPASGKDQPILKTLNNVFHSAGIDWDIYVTKKGGDARRLAAEAAQAGADAVAVYGGDGTVAKAAGNVILRNENLMPIEHWQGREVTVVSQPAQSVQADGEVLPPGSVTVRILPQAVRFVVPGDKAKSLE